MNQATTTRIDPLQLSIIANRLEAAVRDMTGTLLRTARSTVINTARDFSCSLVTADNRLLAATDGLPVHVIGSELLAQAMTDLHADLAPGDAFLHNDPYLGNSHAADHTILSPVFFEGEHVFTVCAKAHQADCGNSVPTTYSPRPADVYEEGALIFPCVRAQRDYRDVDDLVRMCRARIRVPDQWYGDFLAQVGAVRIGEQRVQRLCAEYGIETMRAFVEEWFDYSERRMAAALDQVPSGSVHAETTHDPVPALEDGFRFQAAVTVEHEPSRIVVDLQDNPDNYPGGLNASESTARAGAIVGVFNSLPELIPLNAGSFRRIEVLLREGSMAGIPRFPHSCSTATTDPFERIVSATQMALARLGEGLGLAEGAVGQAPHKSVISGDDPRAGHGRYINQIFIGGAGGPASDRADGSPTFSRASAAGMMFHDSVEIDEQRYPIQIRARRLVADSGGAGRHRGGLGGYVEIAATHAPVTFSYMLDGRRNPPRGVQGGERGGAAFAGLVDDRGEQQDLPAIGIVTIDRGESVISISNGGGGYGDPLARDPESVLEDVLERRVSERAARDVYGVVVSGGELDATATGALRDAQRARRAGEAGR